MSLSSICTLKISLIAGGMTIAGFGTPLILAHGTTAVRTAFHGDIVREYERPADMLTEGWLITDNAYLLAQAVTSQQGRPPTFKVGLRGSANGLTQTIKLTPSSFAVGTWYSGTIDGKPWAYEVIAADDDIPKVVAKLVTAINTANPNATASAGGTPTVTHVLLTADAEGTLTSLVGLSSNLSVEDTTASADVATDLAAIEVEDSDWYALLTDCFGAAEITAVATWVEANKRCLYVAQTSDTDCTGSGSADIMSVIKAADRFRTSIWYQKDSVPTLAAGIVGSQITATPGSNTWHLKSVSGATPSDKLTTSQQANLKNKNGNYYATLAGNGRSFWGYVSGGEYCDTVHFVDWCYARIQEAVVGVLQSGKKTPYTKSGVELIKGAILAVLNTGVTNGGLSDSPAPSVTLPDFTTIPVVDKAARILRAIKFNGTLAGAIHQVLGIEGSLAP